MLRFNIMHFVVASNLMNCAQSDDIKSVVKYNEDWTSFAIYNNRIDIQLISNEIKLESLISNAVSFDLKKLNIGCIWANFLKLENKICGLKIISEVRSELTCFNNVIVYEKNLINLFGRIYFETIFLDYEKVKNKIYGTHKDVFELCEHIEDASMLSFYHLWAGNSVNGDMHNASNSRSNLILLLVS